MAPPAMLRYAPARKGSEKVWRNMRQLRLGLAMILAIGMAAAPAAAQFSDSYKFLKAVRDADGAKVTDSLNDSGSTLINARGDDGDAALHIVVKRRDSTWLSFLLAKGARPDIRDTKGNTPLGLAAQVGFSEGVSALLGAGAGVNVANNQGETPLILAVQARDVVSVRLLLAAGANPALTDRAAGLSAHDYAARDRRSTVILKILDDAKPVKPTGPIAGPRL